MAWSIEAVEFQQRRHRIWVAPRTGPQARITTLFPRMGTAARFSGRRASPGRTIPAGEARNVVPFRWPVGSGDGSARNAGPSHSRGEAPRGITRRAAPTSTPYSRAGSRPPSLRNRNRFPV